MNKNNKKKKDMITKTYGIKGLLEKHCVLKAGGMKMRVSFTNGTLTSNGVAPATFTTSDPLTQFVIENCDKFKRREIEVVRVVDDGRPIEGIVMEEPRTTAQTTTPVSEPQNTQKAAPEDTAHVEEATSTVGNGNNAASEQSDETGGEVEVTNGNDAASGQSDETGGEAEVTIDPDGNPVVRVATKADAVEWLKENFPANNYTGTALRTKAAFEAACAECKVKFIIANA